jgi:hypothetical protein
MAADAGVSHYVAEGEGEEATDRRQRAAIGDAGPSVGVAAACRLLALPPALLSLVTGRLEPAGQRALRSACRATRSGIPLTKLRVRLAARAAAAACTAAPVAPSQPVLPPQPPSSPALAPHCLNAHAPLSSTADRSVLRGRRVRGGGGRQPRAPLPGAARIALLCAGV